MRATTEVARWVSGQLELAELDRSRTRLDGGRGRGAAGADLAALHLQLADRDRLVRPHRPGAGPGRCCWSSRTSPATRSARHGDFTTLAEELRSIEQYLALERARFGDRLKVTLQVAPEVLPVALPFLCLQPLVENAVRHGLEGKPGTEVHDHDRGARTRARRR